MRVYGSCDVRLLVFVGGGEERDHTSHGSPTPGRPGENGLTAVCPRTVGEADLTYVRIAFV